MAAPPPFVAERLDFSRPASVDREKGVVYGVRVLNPVSRNRRAYPEAVSARHAALYAAPCNLGHHLDRATGRPVEPPPQARFGRHLRPRAENAGIVTDFQFNPEHEYARTFLWNVEHDPAALCFSPLHQVKWAARRDADGRLVAESILAVASVDVVTDGGTTDGIFESLNTWAAEMDMPNAADVAGQLETDGAWVAFLTDLFAQMKGLQRATKDAITALVTAALANSTDAAVPADPADPTAAAPALESLRRMGPVGRWAAQRLDALYVAEAQARHLKAARDLIKGELVAEALVTDVFVELVGEALAAGATDRARAIVADRKRLSAGAGRGAATGDRAGPPSLKDLIDGYAAG